MNPAGHPSQARPRAGGPIGSVHPAAPPPAGTRPSAGSASGRDGVPGDGAGPGGNQLAPEQHPLGPEPGTPCPPRPFCAPNVSGFPTRRQRPLRPPHPHLLCPPGTARSPGTGRGRSVGPGAPPARTGQRPWRPGREVAPCARGGRCRAQGGRQGGALPLGPAGVRPHLPAPHPHPELGGAPRSGEVPAAASGESPPPEVTQSGRGVAGDLAALTPEGRRDRPARTRGHGRGSQPTPLCGTPSVQGGQHPRLGLLRDWCVPGQDAAAPSNSEKERGLREVGGGHRAGRCGRGGGGTVSAPLPLPTPAVQPPGCGMQGRGTEGRGHRQGSLRSLQSCRVLGAWGGPGGPGEEQRAGSQVGLGPAEEGQETPVGRWPGRTSTCLGDR